MMDDGTLLHRYATTRDEAAFAELVRRHLDGVYSIARRRVGGDAHLAEDVAQKVFLELARAAPRLVAHPLLAGWLYTTTRHASANVVRGERRRKAREQEVHAMQDTWSKGPAEADWNRLAPVIEQAVDQLGGGDRAAVLLRFIEHRTFGEIGAALRLTEDAARKRVERALEKLRVILGRRGIDSSAAALAAALTANAVTAAPAGLAAVIATTAMSSMAGGGGALAFLALMSMTKFQVAAVSSLLCAGFLGIVFQQQAHAHLRDELVSVRQEAREVARLRAENARLAPADAAPARTGDELGKLREEAGALKQQIAAASKTPLWPGLIPAASWKNAGRATPGDALETLLWAAENGDIQTVGRMVSFDARTRLEADAIYPSMPEVLRQAGGVTSVEEMVGLAWTMGAQLAGTEVIGIRPARTPTEFHDDVALTLRLQKTDGTIRLEELSFHRTPDGWQWVLSHHNLDFVGAGIGSYTTHILDKK